MGHRNWSLPKSRKKEFFCIEITWNIAKGPCPSQERRWFFAYK
jgi:hypothetical protein